MSRLFVNGCSHTYGTAQSLNGNLQEAWPYKLQNLLQYKYLDNYSKQAGSNERIIRTTIEHFAEQTDFPDLAVIQFAINDRLEIPGPKSTNPFFIPYTSRAFTEADALKFIRQSELTIDYTDVWWCTKYINFNKDHHVELYDRKLSYQIVMMQSFFELNNIPYVFIIWESLHKKTYDYLPFKQINKSNVLNWDGYKINSMEHILDTYKFNLTKDNHFDEEGHAFIAESIYNFIQNKVPLVPNGINTDTEYSKLVHVYG